MDLNSSDKRLIAEIESIPLEEARRRLALGQYGKPGNPGHDFASLWISASEAREVRSRHDSISHIARLTLLWTVIAASAAIAAMLMSIIALVK